MLLREVVVQAAHTLFPRLFVSRHNRTPSKSELLRLHLLDPSGVRLLVHAGKMQTFLVHLLGMNLAERYAPTRGVGPHLLFARRCHDAASVCIDRALAYAEKSLEDSAVARATSGARDNR